MASLKDMEEVLQSIESDDIRDYMKEALTCYMTGAYRGCIVLCFIALFDDILDKLEPLTSVNKVAKKIFWDAKKLKDEQEVYENFLIEQLKSNNILNELDADFADILRKLRNKSAHPSGHKPSSEEARFIYIEVITRFLSKPIFSTDYLVDEIIERLPNKNFFVDNQANSLKETVEEEIKNLHDDALPLLVIKLLDNFESSNKDTVKNVNLFFCGLGKLNKEKVNNTVSKNLIQKKCDNEKYDDLILQMLSINPNLFKEQSSSNINRLIKTIENSIKKTKLSDKHTYLRHPLFVLHSLSKIYSDEDFLKLFDKSLSNLFEKWPFSIGISVIIHNKNKTFIKYLEYINEKFSSNDFDTANLFANNASDINKILAKEINIEQSFKVIASILTAADNGAFDSKKLRDGGFRPMKSIKDKATKFVTENPEEAKDYLSENLDLQLDEFISYLK